MILVLNVSAGIDCTHLADYINRKIQPINAGNGKVVFNPDNSDYQVYKATKFGITRDVIEPSDDEVVQIQEKIDNLPSAVAYVNFAQSGADLYGLQFAEDDLMDITDKEVQRLDELYQTCEFPHFIICGVVSPALLKKLYTKYGDSKIQFISIMRNPSVAFAYDNPAFYDQDYAKRVFESAEKAFENQEKLPYEYNTDKLINRLNLINFIQTYINIINLREADYPSYKLENIYSQRLTICSKVVNLGMHFKYVNDYVYSTDLNPDYTQLDIFNDLFSRIRYNYTYYDLFGLLGYDKLSEQQITV